MPRIEVEDDFLLLSVPVNTDGYVTLRDLRDLVEMTDTAPETFLIRVLPDELRAEVAR